jgi:hypothetical protein
VRGFLLALLVGIAGWLPLPASAQSQAICVSYLASNPNPSGIPAVSAPGVAQRAALLADGGKLVAIGSRYYTVSIPSAFYTAATPVVVFDLHGTGGYPEAEWNDWHAAMTARGYAFVGLAWGGGAPGAATDSEIYTQIEQIVQEVGAFCPLSTARKWLMGFSVGSAMSFAVMIRDVADQKLFFGQVAVSGAAIGPLTSGRDVMHSTVEANRSNANAVLGVKAWMYCGEMDLDHGWSMCTEMPNGEAFVNEHGGRAVLYRDPTGTHHSLPSNTAARDEMFDYLVAPEATPVYRFLNTVAGVHFYTASEAEKASILATIPAYVLEGVAFYAYASAGSGRIPVYRFLNTVKGVHFYTASEAEKSSILATIPSLALEGVSYYAMGAAGTGVVPLYRFLNTVTGVHFYTASEVEKSSILATLLALKLEGTAYYVSSQP